MDRAFADAPMAEARLLDGGDRASAPKSKEELLKEARAKARSGPARRRCTWWRAQGEAVSSVLPELPVVHVSKCDGTR